MPCGTGLERRGDCRLRAGDQARPEVRTTYANRSTTYYEKRDFGRAIEDFDQAIRLTPNGPQPYHDRGLAYRDKGDSGRAIANSEPDDQVRSKLSGLCQTRSFLSGWQSFNDALADLDDAIRLNGKFTTTFNDRGLVNAATGETDHAIADFTQTIRINPNYDIAYNNRALTYDAAATSTAPLGTSPRTIKVDPKYDVALNNRGLMYKGKGDVQRAMRRFRGGHRRQRRA